VISKALKYMYSKAVNNISKFDDVNFIEAEEIWGIMFSVLLMF
jgi:hypothetical protein